MNSSADQRAFYQRREAQARKQAELALTSETRLAHTKMADAYAKVIADITKQAQLAADSEALVPTSPTRFTPGFFRALASPGSE